jgi:glycosyltransferase involved in cell wall biosynthesis
MNSLVSIAITSYNYGRYLSDAIDSALNQTYPNVEVIVVDDGSTDNSRELIASYGDRITSILKDNAGQGSGFNTGFAASSGQIVLFLDSDDVLLPTIAERVVAIFSEPEVVKVHWPLFVIDREGKLTGDVKEPMLPEGDFREWVRREGPMTEATLPSAPTSGNAYARVFLEQVMPMPEQDYRISPDAYLFGLAPAAGKIRRFVEPQGFWRFHGANASKKSIFEQKLTNGVNDFRHQVKALRAYYERRGISFETSNWGHEAWWPRMDQSLRQILSFVPEGERFVLIDGDAWGCDRVVFGRQRLHFMERNGMYWGPPDNEGNAIAEVERLRSEGLKILAIVWPAFWWLSHYHEFAKHLRSCYACPVCNEDVILFDLK